MKKLHRLLAFLMLALFSAEAKAAELAGPYVAYSLREAAARCRQGKADSTVKHLGGITRVLAVVADGADDILVGRATPGLPEASLDDLVVALRARKRLGQWPLVDIGPDDQTAVTRQLKVTFNGGIDSTRFGATFLAADIDLKLYSLRLSTMIDGVGSYRDQYATAVSASSPGRSVRWLEPSQTQSLPTFASGRATAETRECAVKFWFVSDDDYVFGHRGGVFCIKELKLAVRHQIIPIGDSDPTTARVAAERFAADFTRGLEKVAAARPAVARLKVLHDLTALAEHIDPSGDQPFLKYYLDDFRPEAVATPGAVELRTLTAAVEQPDGSLFMTQIAGGIQFKSALRWLEKGDIVALRQIVLRSRPAADSLTWTPPLEGWTMPNAQELSPRQLAEPIAFVPGCGVLTQSVMLLPPSVNPDIAHPAFNRFSPPWPVGGVRMNPLVTAASHQIDATGQLNVLKQRLQAGRKHASQTTWPAPQEEN